MISIIAADVAGSSSALSTYGPLGIITAILLAGIAYALVRIANWVVKRMEAQDNQIKAIMEGDYAAARREVAESSADRRTADEERKTEAKARDEILKQLKEIGEFSRETVRAFDSATRHQLEAAKEEKLIIDGLREIQETCGARTEQMAADYKAVKEAEARKRAAEAKP